MGIDYCEEHDEFYWHECGGCIGDNAYRLMPISAATAYLEVLYCRDCRRRMEFTPQRLKISPWHYADADVVLCDPCYVKSSTPPPMPPFRRLQHVVALWEAEEDFSPQQRRPQIAALLASATGATGVQRGPLPAGATGATGPQAG